MENPKAEYGWKAGAIVNVGIKSGTNSLHGDAYAFGRYQNWDARNFFNVANPVSGCAHRQSSGSCQQTPAQLKQFGGVVGGPIKKDKLFFFGGYEGLRSFIGFVGGHIGSRRLRRSAGNPSKSMVDAITALQAAGIPLSAVSMKLAGCTAGATPTCRTVGQLQSTLPESWRVEPASSALSRPSIPATTESGNSTTTPTTRIRSTACSSTAITIHWEKITHSSTQLATDNAPIRTTSITSSWVYTPNSNVVNEARFGYDRVII